MQKNQDSRLGTENITKLMISLAIPAVLAQIVNVLYNIVDRIYIGPDSRCRGCGAYRCGSHFPDHHHHLCLFQLCQRRRRTAGIHCPGTGQPETGRKDPWKCRITASVLFCTSDAVFLCFSKTAAVSFRSQ